MLFQLWLSGLRNKITITLMQQAPEGVSRQHQRGITDTPLTHILLLWCPALSVWRMFWLVLFCLCSSMVAHSIWKSDEQMTFFIISGFIEVIRPKLSKVIKSTKCEYLLRQ